MEKKEILGKYSIELNFVGNGNLFINYWDFFYGNDVCVEFVDGNLYDDNEEVSLPDFIERVKKSILTSLSGSPE